MTLEDQLKIVSYFEGERSSVSRGENNSEGCQEHLRAHAEAGGGVQAPAVGHRAGRGQPHAHHASDPDQDRSGAEQNFVGAVRDNLVMGSTLQNYWNQQLSTL